MLKVLQTVSYGLIVLAVLLSPLESRAEQLQGRTISDAISVLERGDLRIFYSTELVKPWMRVTEQLETGTPRQQLAAILTPHGLQVRDGPRGSLLVVAGENKVPTNRGSILGVVRAADSGALIPNVEIDLVGSSVAPVVALDGRFSFSALDPGRYTVRAQHRDYRWEATQTLEVRNGQPSVIVMAMVAPAIAQLGRVVVGGSQYELLNSPAASQEVLSAGLLEQLPDVGDDPLRAVKRLPGASFGGLSAASHIRGGEARETLVRFDGLRLVNPFHLRDFQSAFSTIDPRVVRSIDVYTGGFPVNYGDRMSGVIDVTSIAPHEPLYHEVGLSFFNTSVLSTGWFADGAAEWVASARRSNLDFWLDTIDTAAGNRPRYTDIFGKFSYEFSNGLKLSANALLFDDDLTLADSDVEEFANADYKDRYFWLRLDQSFGSALTGATILAHTHLDSTRAGVAAKPGDAFGRVNDEREFTIVSLQSDWLWGVSDGLLVSFGGELRDLRGRYRYTDDARYEVLFDVPGSNAIIQRSRDISARPKGTQLGVYASARYRAGPRWTVETGIRWDKQTLEPGHNHRLSPRFGVRYTFSPDMSVRASWGRFYQSQGIDELQVQDGVTSYLAPQRSDHSLIGFERHLGADVDLRVELYDKRMRSLRPRFENLLNTFVLLPELRPDRVRIAPDSARARGYEIHLSQQRGAVSWWVSYSRSSVKDMEAGEESPRSWDQTHTVTAGALWEGEKWAASLGVSQRTGWPTTAVTEDTAAAFPTVRSDRRNNTRFGSYSSTDIRVERRFELPKSTLRLSFEVDNLLGRDNRCCTEYQFEDGIIEFEGRNYFEPIPSLGVLWQF